MPDEILLKMKNITKDFYGNQVLTGVNMELKKGHIIGLVGENGAGKSTLMNILFGSTVIKETGGFEGEIELDGEICNFESPFDALDAGVGMVHQEFMLIPGFQAAENIMLNRELIQSNLWVEVFGERLSQLKTEDMVERAQKSIDTVGVDLDAKTLVSEMPVAHKQFTEIAREIDREATKLLILDEPTAVLTESEAEIMLSVVRRLADMGISVIFISHRLKEIMQICDELVVLRDGKLVKEVPTKETNPEQISEWMVGREIGGGPDREEPIKKIEEMETVLKVRNLWVDMPGERVVNVDLDIKKGEIFGVGGLAGQGKLGIPNGIMGIYPAGGKVEFQGKKIKLNNPRFALDSGMAFVSEDRREVGLLLEEPIDWNISFTVMQTQEKYLKKILGGLIKWRDDRAIAKLAQEYIDLLEIRCTSSRQLAKELSGGNQQKVCLAKAFAVRPDLLFVSEPTRGIDVGAKQLVLDTLHKYNKKFGITIIVCSSELEELRSISDRIAIVSEGKIAGILSPIAPLKEFGALMLEA
ncbi:MAG: sugar ABC transporter ATP-binding protein [Thermotogota bacterium]|nr:sugar ABC transporter ATP-binding protein [Thermotogota bacterium]